MSNIRPREMTIQPKINALLKHDTTKTVGTIAKIITDYLSINIKSKMIQSEKAFKLLLEDILTNFGYLEIQEIEWIMKQGVLGKYGIIYNEISIDTICGKDGWIQQYIQNERIERPKPTTQKAIQEGKPLTIDEYYERHPELREKRKKIELQYKLATNNVTIEMLQEYGIDIDDFIQVQKIKHENEFKEHIRFNEFLKMAIKNEIMRQA